MKLNYIAVGNALKKAYNSKMELRKCIFCKEHISQNCLTGTCRKCWASLINSKIAKVNHWRAVKGLKPLKLMVKEFKPKSSRIRLI
jgi:hypothetical protein